MKRPIALLFCLLMITMPMAGCLGGDDSSDASDEELADWNVHFAATAADLPTCDEDTNGRLYYVEADGQFQVCKTSGWSVIDIQGAAGADGQDGAAGADGAEGSQGPAGIDGSPTLIRVLSSISCETGGNTFEIGSDNNNDGLLDISEIDLTVDLCNGEQGPQGVAGNHGSDGQDGADGAVGPQGSPGADGQNGTDGQDGADGAMGLTGPIGLTGNDGINSLISSMNEPSGVNCAAGGMKISVGFDYDNDGVLAATEIDNSMYICDGADGVTTSLPWANISNIPTDILDGDNDTTYSGNDFAISGQTCSGTSMVIAAIDVTGSIICVYDQDTLYDGNDFATSNQACPTGEFLNGITLTGKLVCSVPVDTTLSEAQVDAFVANNNYANATDVSNMQSVLDNVTTCVIGAYANCSGVNLNNMDLSNMDLTGIDFSHSDILFVNFSNSILEFADFSGANIDNVDFTNSEMAYAILVGADIYNPDFESADLTGVDFSSIHEMTGLFVNYRYTVSSYISSYTGCGGGIYSGYITGYLNNFRSVSISFENATLNGANFGQSLLFTSDFTNASANHANFDGTMKYENYYTTSYVPLGGYLSKTGGDDAAPASCYYSRMEARSSQTYYLISTFTNFDASYSSFERSNVITAADLDYANLMHSNLMYVYIGSADLTGADLGYSWLHFTSFGAATVNGASFSGSNWYQTIWTDGLAYNSNQA